MRWARALAALSAGLAGAAAPADPFAPLAAMNGTWIMATPHAPLVRLVNHCSPTGTFYVCEQAIEGKPQALVVFHAEPGGSEFRTVPLVLPLQRPDAWSRLVIHGNTWVYDDGADAKPGPQGLFRVINVYLTPDRIHFERQRSTDGGVTWVPVQAGDEKRD